MELPSLSLALLLILQVYSAWSQTNEGREFVLVFSRNIPGKFGSLPLELHITTEKVEVDVCVKAPLWPEIPVTCVNVSQGIVRTIYINETLRASYSGVENKTILVEASDDVVVYGVNKELYSNDAFLGIPVKALGTHYVAVTAIPNFPQLDYAEIAIGSINDGTQVNITLTANVQNITFNGENYTASDIISFTLQQYQNAQLLSLYDLSGVSISSSAPVAVFSGNQKNAVTFNPNNGQRGSSGDHLVEMLVPSNNWGAEFVVVPTPIRKAGDFIKITSGAEECNVTVIQSPAVFFSNMTFSLAAYSFKKIHVPSNATNYVQASSPIQVFQIALSKSMDNTRSDPTLLYIAPFDNFIDKCTLTTIPAVAKKYNDFLSITIKQTDFAGLKVDGLAPNSSAYQLYNDSSGMLAVIMYINAGTHRIEHVDNNVVFQASISGHRSLESYAYPAGLRLVDLSTKSTPPESLNLWPLLAAGGAIFAVTLIIASLAVFTNCCHCCGCGARRRKRDEEEEEEYDMEFRRHKNEPLKATLINRGFNSSAVPPKALSVNSIIPYTAYDNFYSKSKDKKTKAKDNKPSDVSDHSHKKKKKHKKKKSKIREVEVSPAPPEVSNSWSYY